MVGIRGEPTSAPNPAVAPRTVQFFIGDDDDPAKEAAHTWPLPMSLALSALALAAITAAGLLHVHTHVMAVRSEENNREDSDTPYEPLGDRGAP